MIQSISSTRPVIIPNIIRLRRGMGKIAIPIKPSQSINTRFKHITAIPTKMDTNGVPVYKLRILDNLIERLIGKKGKVEEFVKLSPENIDTLISNFQQELSFRNSSLKNLYNSLKPETGIILDVFA